MGLWKRMKYSFNQYLLKLADENKKTFGEGRLDCCQLNQKKSVSEVVKKK